MTGFFSDATPTVDRALIYAPYRRDAEYLNALLVERDIFCDVCLGEEDLRKGLSTPPGVLVITHEAISTISMQIVSNHLGGQPAWSELPIFILLDRASPKGELRKNLELRWPRSRQIFYERPVSSIELLSGIQSALLARVRQRDVGEYLNREVELRRELNHRVKNILASVISIFEMTVRRPGSKRDLAENYRGRLHSLANVHSAVFHSDGGENSMAEIAQLIGDPYRSSNATRIAASGPNIMLNRESATTIALCLHELATNATKHGALSVLTGKVKLSWSITPASEPEFFLRWEEIDGPAVSEPEVTGYGTRYIKAALSGMLGRAPRISFQQSGLVCEASGLLSRLRP